MRALEPEVVDAVWLAVEPRVPVPVDDHPKGGHHRHDQVLLPPTLQAAADRGLLSDIETLHLDRGYGNGAVMRLCAKLGIDDVVCSKKRPPRAVACTKTDR